MSEDKMLSLILVGVVVLGVTLISLLLMDGNKREEERKKNCEALLEVVETSNSIDAIKGYVYYCD